MFLASVLAAFGATLSDLATSAWHMVIAIWGGLVVWASIILARWFLKRSTPRRR